MVEKRLPAKSTETEGVEGYVLSNAYAFNRFVAMLSPAEKNAFEAVRKFMEDNKGITTEEYKKIYKEYCKGTDWSGALLLSSVRSNALRKVLILTREAAVTEGSKKPAKEVFQQRAMKDLQVKLSDCFSMMKEREVNTEFMTEDGTSVKVFGFRVRKGIIIEGDACIGITGFGGEEGGTAAIHLRRSLFFKLSKRELLHKENYWDKFRYIREEVGVSLKGQKEFQNFLSLLDFLRSQNITAVISMSRADDDRYTREIKDKYTLALQVKTLEERLRPQEAVQKVCEECKSPTNLLNQLDDHKMNEEAMILRKIIASKAGPKDLDSLMFTWSCRPPANAGEIVIALGGSNLQDVKKSIEKAIAEKEADVRKRAAEAQKTREEIDSAVNAAWENYLRDDLSMKSGQLVEETKQLDNLRKAYEMLRSYKPA